MRKIFISAGHTRKGTDSGAVGNGYKEGDLAAELRDLIVAELGSMNVKPIVDDDKNALQQTINRFRAQLTPTAILLDIHFNAATPQAKGVETFIPNQFTPFERELAEELSAVCADIIGTNVRTGGMKIPGVKLEKESARGTLAWMRQTGENVLLEVCFISNKDEIEKYQFKKAEVAKALAYILYTFSMRP